MRPHAFSLRQLQYAVAVADTGGFRTAAERCHVSQPSLSAQVAQLERALGVRLFERGRRRVLVTEAGRSLVARARRALAEADDLAAAARPFHDPLAGTLRIGIIPTVSPYLLPEIAPMLRAKYPRLTVLWSEEKTGVLLAELEAGSLDAVLLALTAATEGFEREDILEDPFVLVGRPGHALLKSRSGVTMAELVGRDVLLLDDGHCFRDQALALCTTANVREASFRATSLATLAQMVAAGVGVTLLPALSLSVENRHGQLAVRRFARPAPSRRLVLAWRSRSPIAGALRELARVMAAAGRARGSGPRMIRAQRPS